MYLQTNISGRDKRDDIIEFPSNQRLATLSATFFFFFNKDMLVDISSDLNENDAYCMSNKLARRIAVFMVDTDTI